MSNFLNYYFRKYTNRTSNKVDLSPNVDPTGKELSTCSLILLLSREFNNDELKIKLTKTTINKRLRKHEARNAKPIQEDYSRI
jgi:hypothetical protein